MSLVAGVSTVAKLALIEVPLWMLYSTMWGVGFKHVGKYVYKGVNAYGPLRWKSTDQEIKEMGRSVQWYMTYAFLAFLVID